MVPPPRSNCPEPPEAGQIDTNPEPAAGLKKLATLKANPASFGSRTSSTESAIFGLMRRSNVTLLDHLIGARKKGWR